MNNCLYCGEPCRKMFCGHKCKNAYNRETAVRKCCRCECMLTGDHFNLRRRICKECEGLEYKTCPECGNTIDINYFKGKICRNCYRKATKKNEHRRCSTCEYRMVCSWLLQAKLTLICQPEPCASDDYHLAQLDPFEQRFALTLLEERK